MIKIRFTYEQYRDYRNQRNEYRLVVKPAGIMCIELLDTDRSGEKRWIDATECLPVEKVLALGLSKVFNETSAQWVERCSGRMLYPPDVIRGESGITIDLGLVK